MEKLFRNRYLRYFYFFLYFAWFIFHVYESYRVTNVTVLNMALLFSPLMGVILMAYIWGRLDMLDVYTPKLNEAVIKIAKENENLKMISGVASGINLEEEIFSVIGEYERIRQILGNIDPTDNRILEIATKNPKITDEEIGQQINMARQNVNRRRKKLEGIGYRVR